MPALPDLSNCDSCVCFAVRRAARTVTQYYDRCLRPSGLRATQFTLLVLLARSKGLSLNRAAERLGMERTTLTRNLRPLLAKRYVSVRSGKDRRTRVLAVTQKGADALAAALPQWRRAQRLMTERLPPAALKTLAVMGQGTD